MTRMTATEKDDGELRLEPVREFVNSIDLETGADELATPEAVAAWMAERGLAPPAVKVDRPGLERAVALREALRDLLLANAGEGDAGPALAVLNRQAARSLLRLELDEPQRARLACEGEGIDAALGTLLATIYTAMADGTWYRLKACRKHSCRWAFYDRSRNRSRSWCSMSVCGNRVKVSRFRERQGRGEGASTPG